MRPWTLKSEPTERAKWRVVLRHRWLWRAAAAMACLAMMTLIPPGCSDNPVVRYRQLSTFFDGVPAPPGYMLANPPEGFTGQIVSRNPNALNNAAEVSDRINYHYHAPYVRRECFKCHDQKLGFKAAPQGAAICQNCHESYFQIDKADWVHGPTVMQQCQLCHEPHRSPYAGLLKQEQPDLCYQCHDATWIQSDPFHKQVEELICSNCHDPHAAGNRLLLVDARSFQRRAKVKFASGSEHPKWKTTNCVHCHQAGESNQLIAGIDEACVSCHAKQLDETSGAPLHKAVKDKACTVCHTAHKSPRPNLIRPTAERVCFECHKRSEINTPKHPHVTFVDCLVCHTGHRKLHPHMLREGIGVPAEDVQASTTDAPADTLTPPMLGKESTP